MGLGRWGASEAESRSEGGGSQLGRTGFLGMHIVEGVGPKGRMAGPGAWVLALAWPTGAFWLMLVVQVPRESGSVGVWPRCTVHQYIVIRGHKILLCMYGVQLLLFVHKVRSIEASL